MEDYTYDLTPGERADPRRAHARGQPLARPRRRRASRSTRSASAARRTRCGWSSTRDPGPAVVVAMSRHARPVPARRERRRGRRRRRSRCRSCPSAARSGSRSPTSRPRPTAWLTAGAAHHTVMTTARRRRGLRATSPDERDRAARHRRATTIGGFAARGALERRLPPPGARACDRRSTARRRREAIAEGARCSASSSARRGSRRASSATTPRSCSRPAAHDWENAVRRPAVDLLARRGRVRPAGRYADLVADVRARYDVELDVARRGRRLRDDARLPRVRRGRRAARRRSAPGATRHRRAAAELLTERSASTSRMRWSDRPPLPGDARRGGARRAIASPHDARRLRAPAPHRRAVLGVGDACGMFPIDAATRDYDATLLPRFDELAAERGCRAALRDLLPEVLVAGRGGGHADRRRCAPTSTPPARCDPGAVRARPRATPARAWSRRTRSRRARATSAWARACSRWSCSRDRSAAVAPRARPRDHARRRPGRDGALQQRRQRARRVGRPVHPVRRTASGGAGDPDAVFEVLFREALDGRRATLAACSPTTYLSGEPITELDEGRPLFVRTPGQPVRPRELHARADLRGFATLRIGMRVLAGGGRPARPDARTRRAVPHGGGRRAVPRRRRSPTRSRSARPRRRAARGGSRCSRRTPPTTAAAAAWANTLPDEVFASSTFHTIDPSRGRGRIRQLRRAFHGGIAPGAVGDPAHLESRPQTAAAERGLARERCGHRHPHSAWRSGSKVVRSTSCSP